MYTSTTIFVYRPGPAIVIRPILRNMILSR